MTEREMMEEAMETVEREYSVVGVTERFNDSLQVMEKYLPGDDQKILEENIQRNIAVSGGYILAIPEESLCSGCGLYFVTI